MLPNVTPLCGGEDQSSLFVDGVSYFHFRAQPKHVQSRRPLCSLTISPSNFELAPKRTGGLQTRCSSPEMAERYTFGDSILEQHGIHRINDLAAALWIAFWDARRKRLIS
jgi:hypothetical protein